MSNKSNHKERRQFLPPNYRGLLFDLAVFVFNVFLVRLLTRYMSRLMSATFLSDNPQAARILLYIISTAFAAQLVGAYLKRRPLQARLLAQHESGKDDFGFGCLIILHLCLTLVTTVGIVALMPFEPSGGVWVFVFFFSIIPTVIVSRAITPYKKPPTPDWRNSREVEMFADFCLFAYMLVNLAIWGTLTSGSNLRATGIGDVFSRALGFIIISPLILLFYLPPRLLFFVEDYKYRATWISMTLAIAPVAYRLIIGSPLKTGW